MINRYVATGRLVRDPELRRTGTGIPVTNFTIAVQRNFSNQEQQADFIPCVVWNKAAENVDRYCSKGSLVGIDGRLQSRQYETQDGQKRTVIEVVCDSVQFLETKQKEATQTENTYVPGMYQNTQEKDSLDGYSDYQKEMFSAGLNDIMDDDIQF